MLQDRQRAACLVFLLLACEMMAEPEALVGALLEVVELQAADVQTEDVPLFPKEFFQNIMIAILLYEVNTQTGCAQVGSPCHGRIP